jgi:hypothetical protein
MKKPAEIFYLGNENYTVEKVSHFPVPRWDFTNQTLPGRELNYSRPGKWKTFFQFTLESNGSKVKITTWNHLDLRSNIQTLS